MKQYHSNKKGKLASMILSAGLVIFSVSAMAGCSSSTKTDSVTVNDVNDDFDIIGNPASTEAAYKKAVAQEVLVFKDCYEKAQAKGEAVKDYFSNHPVCHAFQTGMLGLGSTNHPSNGSKYFVAELQKVQKQF